MTDLASCRIEHVIYYSLQLAWKVLQWQHYLISLEMFTKHDNLHDAKNCMEDILCSNLGTMGSQVLHSVVLHVSVCLD